MNSYTDEGIVIKRSNLGEADKIITLFTSKHGKISALAKGLRRPSSKRAPFLDLFNRVKFHAIQGRGELDTLTEVELLDTHSSWKKHLGRVNLAYQLCEAIDKLTPFRDPHPELFNILSLSLSQISYLKQDWKLRLENWLIEIVRELGFWPKNQNFTGDIYAFIESISSRPLHSPKLLSKLK